MIFPKKYFCSITIVQNDLVWATQNGEQNPHKPAAKLSNAHTKTATNTIVFILTDFNGSEIAENTTIYATNVLAEWIFRWSFYSFYSICCPVQLQRCWCYYHFVFTSVRSVRLTCSRENEMFQWEMCKPNLTVLGEATLFVMEVLTDALASSTTAKAPIWRDGNAYFEVKQWSGTQFGKKCHKKCCTLTRRVATPIPRAPKITQQRNGCSRAAAILCWYKVACANVTK